MGISSSYCSKKTAAMYRLTVYYRPVNAATVRNTRPMTHIDAFLQVVRGPEAFPAIGSISGYWKLPMHLESQYWHAFMTPDGVIQPTRTTQSGFNSTASFQACEEPCYSAIRENLLALLNDSAPSTKLRRLFFVYCSDVISSLLTTTFSYSSPSQHFLQKKYGGAGVHFTLQESKWIHQTMQSFTMQPSL